MKTDLKIVVTVVTAICGVGLRCAFAEQETPEAIYQQWHKALDENPILCEPQFFRSDTSIADFDSAVGAILSNKFAMAYFLCEKMARTEVANVWVSAASRLYRDVHLLDEVAGINLIFADDRPTFEQNIELNIERNLRRFKEEWAAGVYKDPSKQVKELCEAKRRLESEDKISPQEVVSLRRCGIFGLPELVRQMKKNNSKHALAAYLIITGQRDEYADYIANTTKLFANAEAKLKHVQKWLDGAKHTARGAEPEKLIEKISKALAD